MSAGTLMPVCLNLSKFQSCTIVIPKRFRYYWDQRPEGKHRKMLMIATLPRLKEKKDVYVKPKLEEEKLYGLDAILHEEAKKIFESSRMLCAVIKSDMVFEDDYYRVQYQLRSRGMDMQSFPEHVMKFTLRGTPYESMTALFTGAASCVVYGEPNVSEMLHALKPNIHLLLLGGLIDRKFYSVKELTSYATLPTLDGAHAQLSASLSSAKRSTHDILQRPASSLSSALASLASSTAEETTA